MESNLKSLTEQIAQQWHNCHSGTCLVLGAGPSLAGFTPQKLAELAEGKTVFAIKQAYLRCPSLVDYHFVNDNNFTPVTYDRFKTKVVVAAPANHVPRPLVELADYLCVIGNNWDFSQSLSASHNFDAWTLDKSPFVRPWGPGITYEVVFYMAVHLGFNAIETIGWDLGPKGSLYRSHFYDDVKPTLVNPAAPLNKGEAEREIALTAGFNRWLTSRGVTLTILNQGSYADESIERKIC